jgi:hypothetical protein
MKRDTLLLVLFLCAVPLWSGLHKDVLLHIKLQRFFVAATEEGDSFFDTLP